MSAMEIYAGGLRWEWFRLRRRVGFWTIIGILALIVVGTLAATYAMRYVPLVGEVAPPYGFPHAVFETLSRLAPFLGLLLAGFIFGGEFGWGTWRTSLARGMASSRLLLTKMGLGAVILAIIWTAAWCLAAVIGLAAGDDAPGGLIRQIPGYPDGWGEAFLKFASAWPVALTYLALGALLCVVGRSTAFGVGVGIGIVFAEMIGHPLATAIAELAWDVQLNDVLRWTPHGATRGLLGNDDLRAIAFLPVVLAYAGLFCWLTLLVFSRRDVDSGNG